MLFLSQDWVRHCRLRVTLQTHRRRRVKRRHNDHKHGHFHVENDFTAVFGQIHFGPETNEHLPKSDTNQVNTHSECVMFTCNVDLRKAHE